MAGLALRIHLVPSALASPSYVLSYQYKMFSRCPTCSLIDCRNVSLSPLPSTALPTTAHTHLRAAAYTLTKD
jgi:hypothetical protein